jgi:hypothetical protein
LYLVVYQPLYIYVYRRNVKLQDKKYNKKIDETMWALFISNGNGNGDFAHYDDALFQMEKCFSGDDVSHEFRYHLSVY